MTSTQVYFYMAIAAAIAFTAFAIGFSQYSRASRQRYVVAGIAALIWLAVPFVIAYFGVTDPIEHLARSVVTAVAGTSALALLALLATPASSDELLGPRETSDDIEPINLSAQAAEHTNDLIGDAVSDQAEGSAAESALLFSLDQASDPATQIANNLAGSPAADLSAASIEDLETELTDELNADLDADDHNTGLPGDLTDDLDASLNADDLNADLPDDLDAGLNADDLNADLPDDLDADLNADDLNADLPDDLDAGLNADDLNADLPDDLDAGLTDDLNADFLEDLDAEPSADLNAKENVDHVEDLEADLTDDLDEDLIADLESDLESDLPNELTDDLNADLADAPARVPTSDLAGQLDGDGLARVSINADNSSALGRQDEELHPDLRNALVNSKPRIEDVGSAASSGAAEGLPSAKDDELERQIESQNRSFFSALDSMDNAEPQVTPLEDPAATTAEPSAERPTTNSRSRQIEHPSLLYRALNEPDDEPTATINSATAAPADAYISDLADSGTDDVSALSEGSATASLEAPVDAQSDGVRQHATALTLASHEAELESRLIRAERLSSTEREAREAAESLVTSQRQLIDELRVDVKRYSEKVDTLETAQRTQLEAAERSNATASHSKQLAEAAVEARRAAEAEAAHERTARQEQEAATKRAVAIARNAIAALAQRERKTTDR